MGAAAERAIIEGCRIDMKSTIYEETIEYKIQEQIKMIIKHGHKPECLYVTRRGLNMMLNKGFIGRLMIYLNLPVIVREKSKRDYVPFIVLYRNGKTKKLGCWDDLIDINNDLCVA